MFPEQAGADDAAEARATGGGAEVVEWGDTGANPLDGRRGGRARGLSGLWAPHRRAPLLAGVAALCLFAALLSDWRSWTFVEEGGPQQITSSVLAFGAAGAAFLIGLFALSVCGTLALFGAGPVRRHARLAGLAVAGALGAIVIAAVVNLDQLGGTIDELISRDTGLPGGAPMAYERGVFLAFAGVAAAALAFYLAPVGAPDADQPTAPAPPAHPAHGPDPESTAAWAAEQTGPGDDWPWRSREPQRRRDEPVAGPADLTVEPATPFLPPPTDPDR